MSIVSHLKDRVQLQNAKIDQLKVQNEALKKSVPTETHLQLKKQMRDLLRRHQVGLCLQEFDVISERLNAFFFST